VIAAIVAVSVVAIPVPIVAASVIAVPVVLVVAAVVVVAAVAVPHWHDRAAPKQGGKDRKNENGLHMASSFGNDRMIDGSPFFGSVKPKTFDGHLSHPDH